MDSTAGQCAGAPRLVRQPSAAVLRTEGVLVLAALLVLILTLADPLALILTVPLVLACVALLCRDLLARPVLSADGSGGWVRVGAGRRCFTWSSVTSVGIDPGRGGLGGYLVIDADPELFHVPAWRLGGDLAGLVTQLDALRRAPLGT